MLKFNVLNRRFSAVIIYRRITNC
ncbi:hypothetical protein AZZ92_002546, partial [Escherichia coli]